MHDLTKGRFEWDDRILFVKRKEYKDDKEI